MKQTRLLMVVAVACVTIAVGMAEQYVAERSPARRRHVLLARHT